METENKKGEIGDSGNENKQKTERLREAKEEQHNWRRREGKYKGKLRMTA